MKEHEWLEMFVEACRTGVVSDELQDIPPRIRGVISHITQPTYKYPEPIDFKQLGRVMKDALNPSVDWKEQPEPE